MIVEVATFRVADGVADDEFIAIDAAYQADLMRTQPGFVRRTVARGGADWVAVSLWWSDATAAEAAGATTAEASAFRKAIDAASWSVRRYESLD